MQKFTRIAALLLVVVAVILAIAAFSLGRRAARPAVVQAGTNAAMPAGHTAGTSTVSVVAAAGDLPAGQPIAASSLHLVPAAQKLPDGYTAIDAVVGDVPLVDIRKDTPITANLLAHGVAMALKPGERALAVPVDEQAGAGNRVLPGDYVDVFLSLKPGTASYGQKKEQTQTRLLLSRLRVLAYGSRDLPRPAEVSDSASDKAAKATSENPPQPRTAVLAVPVGEVDQLLLGAQDGKLALALRHPGDDGQPDRALFPQPQHVLAPLAKLDAGQRQALDLPENRAFAGIDGEGLAGKAHAGPATARRPVRTAPRVEIIRGTQAHSL
ncbi:Flp pilus assembly protein CpaB [Fulvimonas sp. R45]|uniref:Flp pilus assembly protein CpaB n=1 Tax=Fulvimonas sp. R45 TaxID=3045937 RepID=UPI00266033B3|nr:Flp pilus assembly protein CpaB [Fulvimonas sp. R45]MDO1528435.1 Flp pilus assembly protein CpaB [Fulvimonas sp. R45]